MERRSGPYLLQEQEQETFYEEPTRGKRGPHLRVDDLVQDRPGVTLQLDFLELLGLLLLLLLLSFTHEGVTPLHLVQGGNQGILPAKVQCSAQCTLHTAVCSVALS